MKLSDVSKGGAEQNHIRLKWNAAVRISQSREKLEGATPPLLG